MTETARKGTCVREVAVMLILVVLVGGIPAVAHHSYSAFNMGTEATIAGMINRVDWTNPHIWIWIDVPSPEGVIQTWGLEGMSPNYLERRGWTRTTLKAGDEITARFRPMKNGDKGGMFVSTTLSDGKVLSMGGAAEP